MRSIRDLKGQLTLLGKVTLLERDSTLTIFTSKVIDVPSTFRNEDNEYVPRTPIDLGGRYRDTLTSLKARSSLDARLEKENVQMIRGQIYRRG